MPRVCGSVHVPMVKVWLVGVGVHHRFVPVLMGVPRIRRQPGMGVVMVTIVMSMGMRVPQGLVAVAVAVLCTEHEREGSDHEDGGPDLCSQDRLSEHQPGKGHPDEGCACEDHL